MGALFALGNILITIPSLFSRKLKRGEIKKNENKDRSLEDREEKLFGK